MDKIKETLSSRKFWAALLGAVLLAVNGDYTAAAAMIATYIAAQGAVDTAKALRK